MVNPFRKRYRVLIVSAGGGILTVVGTTYTFRDAEKVEAQNARMNPVATVFRIERICRSK